MGKGFIDPKKSSTYALVHKSVKDPTYEDEDTARTMVHVTKNSKKRADGLTKDIIREDMTAYQFDMQNPDDDDEKELFDDQVYADFDQDFIQKMMDAPSDEEEEEIDMEDYPQHDGKGDLDEEFIALMKTEYKPRDMEVEENDPRTDGLLPVDAYIPALKEFADGKRRGEFLKENQGKENFMTRLEPTGEEVFHERDGGQFYTAIVSKKDIDIIESYQEGMAEARELALRRLEVEEARKEKRLAEGGEEEEPKDYEYVAVKRDIVEDRMDCQTVLTTMSTLENHPSVIGAEKGRIRIDKRTGKLVRENKLTSKNLDKVATETALAQLEKQRAEGPAAEEDVDSAAANSAADDEDDRESVGESMITVIDTTVKRCKEETAEEKRARKQQVKEEKKMKRVAKKDLKTAYKAETIRQRYVGPQAKQAMVEMSLR